MNGEVCMYTLCHCTPPVQFLDYMAEQPLIIELWGNQSDKDEAFGNVKAPSKRGTPEEGMHN